MYKRFVCLMSVALILLAACARPATVQRSAATPAPTVAAEPETTLVVPTDTVEPQPSPTPVALPGEPAFETAPCPFTLPPDEKEGETVVCGFVNVPELHGDPDSGMLQLAVVVFKSQSGAPKPDPVILLSGGPGEKTVENAANMLSILGQFRGQRDIIVFDQRGVGQSKPALECPEFVQAILDNLDEIDSQTGLRLMFDAIMSCRDRLVAQGHNLAAYNTTENAADVDDIRRALGYDQVNLYGGSYGSLLAQAVMRDHPEGIRSVVIGAVLPANRSFFVHVPTTSVNAVLRLLDNCAADDACNRAYPNLKQTLYDVVDRLNAGPAPITVTNSLDGKNYPALLGGDAVFSNLVNFLYITDIIPVLPQAIHDVSQGKYDLMTRLTGMIFLLANATSRGMTYSVMCAEDLIGVTPEQYLEVRAQMPRPLAGSADPEDIIEYGFFGICENWPVPQADPSVKQPVKSDVPTLLLEGELDPVTPIEYAREVAGHLTNGTVIEFPGIGHNVLVASPCARRIALDFVNDPASSPDASCVADMQGVVFDLPKEAPGDIVLEPVTDVKTGLQAVAPAGWNRVAPGTFVRQQTSLDSTALIYDNVSMTPDDFMQLIASRLKLDAPPTATATLEANDLAWNLYSTTVQGVMLDIAAAAVDDQTTRVVIMQSLPAEREMLYQEVFLPAIKAFVPVDK